MQWRAPRPLVEARVDGACDGDLDAAMLAQMLGEIGVVDLVEPGFVACRGISGGQLGGGRHAKYFADDEIGWGYAVQQSRTPVPAVDVDGRFDSRIEAAHLRGDRTAEGIPDDAPPGRSPTGP